MKKRVITLALVLAMCISHMPAAMSATGDTVYTDSHGKQITIPDGGDSCAIRVHSFTPGDPWMNDEKANPDDVLGVPDYDSAEYVRVTDLSGDNSDYPGADIDAVAILNQTEEVETELLGSDIGTFNGHTYTVFDEGLTWHEAKALCESLGGHLATITSKVESDYILSVLNASGHNNAYLGATDIAQEGAWTWVTGEPLNYLGWDSGEPNNEFGREHYLLFNSDGTWNDIPDERWPFICEWEATDQPSGKSGIQMQLYSTRPSLSLTVGDEMQLGILLFDHDTSRPISDISNIIFAVEDSSILELGKRTAEHDFLYVAISALSVGVAYITIQDHNSGEFIRVPITVSARHNNVYTVYNVPSALYEKDYYTNFYNFSGMYVDNYSHNTGNDGTENIKFDVYSTGYLFGVVEVCDQNGLVIDCKIIDRAPGHATSIKSSIADTLTLISDMVNGTILSYRQKTGYASHTPIEVYNIPRGGYVRISNDPASSAICTVVNAAVILFEAKSLVSGAFDGWNDATATEFAGSLSTVIADELGKDSYGSANMIMKSIGTEIVNNSTSLSNFLESALYALDEINLWSIIFDTAREAGISVGENALEALMGVPGTVLKSLFYVNEMINFQTASLHFSQACGSGYIEIQVPSDNTRHSSGVTVEADNGFNRDIAFQVYRLYYDEDLLEILEREFGEEIDTEIIDLLKELENAVLYEISLIKDGAETQPDGSITITIPFPPELKDIGLYGNLLRIYRVEEDGTLTEMDVIVESNEIKFTTDHLSPYIIAPTENTNPFEDVTESDWFYNDVIFAYQNGLINGTTATTFSPNNNLTYAEAVKLAACMHQLYAKGSVSLSIGNVWYQPFVDYAKENGITEKDYVWDMPATRADYMEIFANSLPDEALSEINSIPSGSIPDVTDEAQEGSDAIYKLYRAGIVQGVDAAHSAVPSANIRRSEVATILTRMMDETARVRFVIGV